MTKNKKIFAVCLLVFQILIIAGLVVYSALFSSVLDRFGKEYKIKAKQQMYVSDGVCHFDVYGSSWSSDGKIYIVPSYPKGIYMLDYDYGDVPKDAVDYIYCKDREEFFPETTEYKLKNAESLDSYYSFDEKDAYVTVKVFMGKAEVTGVYCDGVPIEEYVEKLDEFWGYNEV